MNNNHSITVGLLPLQHPAGLYLTVTTTAFSSLLTPEGVSCFPWFHHSSTAIGISLLALLNDVDQLFCRSRAARLSWHPQRYTSALAEDPSSRKPAFSPKSRYSRHVTWIPTRFSAMRALGLNVQLLQWLAPSWDRTLGNGKIGFLEGSILKQTPAISPFKWLYSDSSHTHGKLCSVPTDVTSKTSSWISQEQTLTLRVE